MGRISKIELIKFNIEYHDEFYEDDEYTGRMNWITNQIDHNKITSKEQIIQEYKITFNDKQ